MSPKTPRRVVFSPLFSVLLALGGLSQAALAITPAKTPAGKPSHYTYPQPPTAKPTDPLAVFPGWQVPEHPERYVWKTTAKSADKANKVEAAAAAAPIHAYSFDSDGHGGRIGVVSDGIEVKLDSFRRVGGALYYAVKVPVTANGKTFPEVWIDGRSIAAVSYTPPAK